MVISWPGMMPYEPAWVKQYGQCSIAIGLFCAGWLDFSGVCNDTTENDTNLATPELEHTALRKLSVTWREANAWVMAGISEASNIAKPAHSAITVRCCLK